MTSLLPSWLVVRLTPDRSARRLRLTSGFVTVLALAGCSSSRASEASRADAASARDAVSPTDAAAGEKDAAASSKAADIAQYKALTQELNANATLVANLDEGNLNTMNGLANQLFFSLWSYEGAPEAGVGEPGLYHYDDTTSATFRYTWPLTTSYALGSSLITTLDLTGATMVLTAYRTSDPTTVLGSLTLAASSIGGMPPTAIDGAGFYYVDTSGDPSLVEWTPPATSSVALFKLSALGIAAAGPKAFTVTGTTVLLEDAKADLWSIDVSTQTATSLGTFPQATGGTFDAQGFLYTTGTDAAPSGLSYFDFATKKTTDIVAALLANPYALNPTYASIHHYGSGAAIKNGVVYYIGEQGSFFRFELSTGTVTPLLLAVHSDPAAWAGPPVILDDGSACLSEQYIGNQQIWCVPTGG